MVGIGNASLLSPEYIVKPRAICFVLFKQAVACAFSFALLKAGSSMAAKMAMIAMTTSNSINVKADFVAFALTKF